MVVLGILEGCRETGELLLVVGSVEGGRGYGVEEFVDRGALVVDVSFMDGIHSLEERSATGRGAMGTEEGGGDKGRREEGGGGGGIEVGCLVCEW